ncbi:hypothetical protein [Micromonospora sp. LOL_023]|uniref:hypothetical protein n=1 Tax=Micromonospora sp. LOL_023 TaxID=3345418 RepID=UPI003A87445D
MKTIQAHRFALDLNPGQERDANPGQERDVLAHAGAARVAYNPARHPPVRPGPSRRKAGLPTGCSLKRTER